MYSKLHAFLFSVLFIGLSLTTFSQTWTQTRGPGGGLVAEMVEKNGAIIATTLGGIFRSTDNGDTWHRAMNGIEDANNFHTVTATTNYVWAANLNGGPADLYRSADGGLSWAYVDKQVPGSFFISKIFGSHDTLYLGCDGCGVYRSVNEGASFQNFNNGYPGSAYVYSFAQIGGTLFTGLAGNGGTPGVYRTSVSSANWVQVNTGLPSPMSVIDLAVKGNDLLATGGNIFTAGLFRSSNLGTTWTTLNPNIPAPEIPTKLAVSGNNIYFGTDGDAPYRSTDNGVTFQRVATGLKQTSVFSFLAGSAGVFVGYERGVARTTDNGASWQRKVTGLAVSSITSVYSNDNTTLYATGRTQNIGSNDGVFSSTDGGQNWTSIDQGLQPNPNVNKIVKSGSNLIIATDNNGMFIKTPTDAAFRRPNVDAILFYDAVLSLVTYGNYIFAGIAGNPEMIRSADNGLTWTQANNGFRTDLTDQTTALYEKNGVIWAGGFDAVYKSTDLGVSWTLSNTGIYPGTTVNGFTSIGNDLYAATEGNGLYKSTNNGASWTQVVINAPVVSGGMKSIISTNNTLYIATIQGVIKGANGGTSWSTLNAGLQSSNGALSITVFNNSLVLGTAETAVWMMPLSTVLPVKLINFNALPVGNKLIRTSFTVAEESGIQSYEIQRTTSGSNNFVSISSIASENSALQKTYSFDDLYAEKNVRYQYRLLINQASGNKYSEVRTAMITGKNIFVSVSPNPSEGIIKVNVNGYKGKAGISVLNATGQTVYKKDEMLDAQTSLIINLSRQSKGLYIIHVKTGDEIVSEKILIR